MNVSVLKNCLKLEKTSIKDMRIEEDSIILNVRPHKAKMRCPICNKVCEGYDRAPLRRWRTLDLGCNRTYLEYSPKRMWCAKHGVLTERVPWARDSRSRFSAVFEDDVAWHSLHMSKSALARDKRIDWHTVGVICERVYRDLESKRSCDRFSNLSSIGIDETSYKKGHKYLTVIIDHTTSRIIWATKGFGKAKLKEFFSMMSEEQKCSIQTVTADGARWIAACIAEELPHAELAIDPFHVISWTSDALDNVRRELWKQEKKKPHIKRRRDRPKKGEQITKDSAQSIKGSRFALLKGQEHISEKQSSTLDELKKSAPKLMRAYALKEGLRCVFKTDALDAREELGKWLSWACRSRIPQFVDLSRKIRRKKDAIIRAIELGISNARVESINNKIKVTIRQCYGFRNIDNLIAMIMLRCSDIQPQLPGREAA